MVYTGTLMTENAFYPLFLATVARARRVPRAADPAQRACCSSSRFVLHVRDADAGDRARAGDPRRRRSCSRCSTAAGCAACATTAGCTGSSAGSGCSSSPPRSRAAVRRSPCSASTRRPGSTHYRRRATSRAGSSTTSPSSISTSASSRSRRCVAARRRRAAAAARAPRRSWRPPSRSSSSCCSSSPRSPRSRRRCGSRSGTCSTSRRCFLIALLAWIDVGAPRPAARRRRRRGRRRRASGRAPVHDADRRLARSRTRCRCSRSGGLQDTVITLQEVQTVVVLAAVAAVLLFLVVPRRALLVLPALVLLFFALEQQAIESSAHGIDQASVGSLFSGIADRRTATGSTVRSAGTRDVVALDLGQRTTGASRSGRTSSSTAASAASTTSGLYRCPALRSRRRRHVPRDEGRARPRTGSCARRREAGARRVRARRRAAPALAGARVAGGRRARRWTCCASNGPLRSAEPRRRPLSGRHVVREERPVHAVRLPSAARSRSRSAATPGSSRANQTVVARVGGRVVGRASVPAGDAGRARRAAPAPRRPLRRRVRRRRERPCRPRSPTARTPTRARLGAHFNGFDVHRSPVRIVFDVTPLSHRRAGIGNYLLGALRGLAEAGGAGRRDRRLRADERARASGSSTRRSTGSPWSARCARCRVAHALRTAWSRLGTPAGRALPRRVRRAPLLRLDVPAAAGGMRATTVHDLVPLRFPRVDDGAHAAHARGEVPQRGAHLRSRLRQLARSRRGDVVELLGVPEERVRVAYPGVGGGLRAGGRAAPISAARTC